MFLGLLVIGETVLLPSLLLLGVLFCVLYLDLFLELLFCINTFFTPTLRVFAFSVAISNWSHSSSVFVYYLETSQDSSGVTIDSLKMILALGSCKWNLTTYKN